MIIKQCGKIIEKKSGSVVVSIAPDTACEGCKGCAQSSKPRKITVKTDKNLKIGDSVEIETDSKDALKAGVILFLFPVLGLIAGTAAPLIFIPGHSSGQIVICGFCGAFLPVFFIKKFFSNITLNRKIHKKTIT